MNLIGTRWRFNKKEEKCSICNNEKLFKRNSFFRKNLKTKTVKLIKYKIQLFKSLFKNLHNLESLKYFIDEKF